MFISTRCLIYCSATLYHTLLLKRILFIIQGCLSACQLLSILHEDQLLAYLCWIRLPLKNYFIFATKNTKLWHNMDLQENSKNAQITQAPLNFTQTLLVTLRRSGSVIHSCDTRSSAHTSPLTSPLSPESVRWSAVAAAPGVTPAPQEWHTGVSRGLQQSRWSVVANAELTWYVHLSTFSPVHVPLSPGADLHLVGSK